jgi:hypothetical protein
MFAIGELRAFAFSGQGLTKMAHAKLISYVDAVMNNAIVDLRSVTEDDLVLALEIIEDELVELRARVAQLEQGGDIPNISDGKT